ncbi:30S ribosomal protein S5 [Candidatus Collierbacteria bacterium]|nr:30S ribosomal protein S5 [Candidatus Collierbacteria bacterium]
MREQSEFAEKIIQINRVSKKTQGGNKMAFSVLMVVGDKKGRVGIGLGKAPDVLSGIKKASRRAKDRMINVPIVNTTIPFPMSVKLGAVKIILRPAPSGTGIIAGGAIRAILDVAGYRNVVCKILGTSNPASNTYATLETLAKMSVIAKKKGIEGIV